MVFLTVSTGIGGGVVIDGKLYRGMTGTAGEFGHMIVDATGAQPCTCGNRGCLMGAASGIRIPEVARRVAERLASSGSSPDLPRGCEGYECLDGIAISAGCAEGNELCRAVVEEFARYIGIGMYNIFQILNPNIVVLGGGLLNFPEFFFEGAMKTCYNLAGSMMYDLMDIRKGLLGAQAGIMGAVALIEP